MFCARRRWFVIGVWLVLLALAVPFAPQLPGALRSGGFTLNDLEASRARQLLESELNLPPSAMVIVLQSQTDARAGDPAFELAAAQTLARVPVRDAVTDVPGMQAYLAGGPASSGHIEFLSEHDLQRSEFISLPLAAL